MPLIGNKAPNDNQGRRQRARPTWGVFDGVELFVLSHPRLMGGDNEATEILGSIFFSSSIASVQSSDEYLGWSFVVLV